MSFQLIEGVRDTITHDTERRENIVKELSPALAAINNRSKREEGTRTIAEVIGDEISRSRHETLWWVQAGRLFD